MVNYEQVLHFIRYKNWHTEALFDRKFKLVCSELNGRYISNDFKVEVRLSLHRRAFSVYSFMEIRVLSCIFCVCLVLGECYPHG